MTGFLERLIPLYSLVGVANDLSLLFLIWYAVGDNGLSTEFPSFNFLEGRKCLVLPLGAGRSTFFMLGVSAKEADFLLQWEGSSRFFLEFVGVTFFSGLSFTELAALTLSSWKATTGKVVFLGPFSNSSCKVEVIKPSWNRIPLIKLPTNDYNLCKTLAIETSVQSCLLTFFETSRWHIRTPWPHCKDLHSKQVITTFAAFSRVI